MVDLESRVKELELKLNRIDRLMDMLMQAFPTPIYPLVNRDASEEQIRAVLHFLRQAAGETNAGNGISPAAFSKRVFELLPQSVDDVALPGILATWCAGTTDTQPLYRHLRDAGLANIDHRADDRFKDES
jgi:hypothetical protein